MWYHTHSRRGSEVLAASHASRSIRHRMPGILSFFIFIAIIGTSTAFAQSNRDEFRFLQSYAKPDTAVHSSQIVHQGDVYLRDGKPFTGLLYETFPGGKLSRVMALRDGAQHGPTYLWYPDGTPQMSANYSHGRINGRFLGWYANGGVIYDMVITGGGYAGDFIEDDGSRAPTDTVDTEREGTDND